MTHYIEDVLHLLVNNIGIKESDQSIMTSISRQLQRGIALTDRQYQLMLDKISAYKLQLESNNIFFENRLPTKLPLRVIDRSKTIDIVTHAEMNGDKPYETHKQNWLWIKVRFPFSKKLIAKLDSIKISNASKYHHVKGTHEHFFRLNGSAVVKIINAFKHSNFEIQDAVMDYYYKSQDILDNSDKFIAQVKDNQFYNVPDDIVKDLYNYNSDLIVADRRIRFGYKTCMPEYDQSLTQKIAFRKTVNFNVDPEQYSLEDIANAIKHLQRFPALVLIDESDSFEQLKLLHRVFDYIDNTKQSVLFRIDNTDSKNFNLNQYIKDNVLNNWVDETTQIVYIKKNQLPKILLNSNFKPITAISITSYRNTSNVDVYCKFNCDLIICHDKEQSYFGSKFGLYHYG